MKKFDKIWKEILESHQKKFRNLGVMNGARLMYNHLAGDDKKSCQTCKKSLEGIQPCFYWPECSIVFDEWEGKE